jgi:outer membrane lipoprotein-sorting protein
MRTKVYLIAVFFSIYFAISTLFAFAKTNDNSSKTIKEIDNYLASIKSMESDFLQTDSNGIKRTGRVYIKKPNRVRVEYFTPEKELILLNSELVMHYVPDLESTNYVPGEELALSLLSQKNFRVSVESNIKRLDISNNAIVLDFVIKNDKCDRLTSLTFSSSPIKLKSMRIYQGDEFVSINFIGPIINESISSWIFNFNNKEISG